ncbi:MAG TPA: hypothetical protein VFS59_11470 [Gemmatimonadaceae bacterium]|nr:hypothetical protein [Gemmatimonadaceae bacterium]
MSSLHRTIEGDAIVRHLTQDQREIDQALLAKHGRSARTLVKEGPLRLTLTICRRRAPPRRIGAEGDPRHAAGQRSRYRKIP